MKREILTACLVAALFALPMAVIPVLPSVHGDTHDYTVTIGDLDVTQFGPMKNAPIERQTDAESLGNPANAQCYHEPELTRAKQRFAAERGDTASFAVPQMLELTRARGQADQSARRAREVAQGQSWNAFAAVQIEEPPPRPVEGKKHRDRKHQDEEEPTPAPAPEPDALPEPVPPKPEVDPEFSEVYPEGKRPKPLPQPDRHVKPEKPNRDSHDTKVVNTVVYRTSWFPSLYDLVALSLSALNLYIARRQGFDFRTLFTLWK